MYPHATMICGIWGQQWYDQSWADVLWGGRRGHVTTGKGTVQHWDTVILGHYISHIPSHHFEKEGGKKTAAIFLFQACV